MKNKKIKYFETWSQVKKMIRVELGFAPFLVLLPIFISILFIWSWYYKGYLAGNSIYDGHLILGLIILVLNIVFDIPFIKSLITYSKK
jgi:hypothetical protein